jgi:hypothetical protein
VCCGEKDLEKLNWDDVQLGENALRISRKNVIISWSATSRYLSRLFKRLFSR